MKPVVLNFAILLLALLLPAAALADRRGFVNTIVIDPGHGGRDPGAVGTLIKEKDVVLDISKKLGELIRKNLPTVRVIYTRTDDTFIELHQRARIANENQADLFVSIHLNSARSPNAIGTETFVMGLHRTDANLEVARRENASILFEENFQEIYDGYDPHSPESSIIFSLFQNAYLNQSLKAASLIQDQFRLHARRIDRGVKQAGFLVLYRVTAPAILVEAGFISNPREQEFLASAEGQQIIAQSIFNGIAAYILEQEKLANQLISQSPQEGNRNPVQNSAANQSRTTPEQSTSQITIPSVSQNQEADITFKVQFAVSSTQRPLNAPEWRALDRVGMYFHLGQFKYTSGVFSTLQQAVAHQARVRRAGFSDAFVVAFRNNVRISTDEALRLLQNQNNP